MKYEFDKVAILCTTDKQVQHLETMTETAYTSMAYYKNVRFVYFREIYAGANIYSNFDTPAGLPVVTYEEFISGMNEPDTQVVEVNGCEECPLFEQLIDSEWCNHPDHDNESDILFSLCPLKKGSVTIKLKN